MGTALYLYKKACHMMKNNKLTEADTLTEYNCIIRATCNELQQNSTSTLLDAFARKWDDYRREPIKIDNTLKSLGVKIAPYTNGDYKTISLLDIVAIVEGLIKCIRNDGKPEDTIAFGHFSEDLFKGKDITSNIFGGPKKDLDGNSYGKESFISLMKNVNDAINMSKRKTEPVAKDTKIQLKETQAVVSSEINPQSVKNAEKIKEKEFKVQKHELDEAIRLAMEKAAKETEDRLKAEQATKEAEEAERRRIADEEKEKEHAAELERVKNEVLKIEIERLKVQREEESTLEAVRMQNRLRAQKKVQQEKEEAEREKATSIREAELIKERLDAEKKARQKKEEDEKEKKRLKAEKEDIEARKREFEKKAKEADERAEAEKEKAKKVEAEKLKLEEKAKKDAEKKDEEIKKAAEQAAKKAEEKLKAEQAEKEKKEATKRKAEEEERDKKHTMELKLAAEQATKEAEAAFQAMMESQRAHDKVIWKRITELVYHKSHELASVSAKLHNVYGLVENLVGKMLDEKKLEWCKANANGLMFLLEFSANTKQSQREIMNILTDSNEEELVKDFKRFINKLEADQEIVKEQGIRLAGAIPRKRVTDKEISQGWVVKTNKDLITRDPRQNRVIQSVVKNGLIVDSVLVECPVVNIFTI